MSSDEIRKLKRRAVGLAGNPALNFYDLALSLAELHEADRSISATILPSLGMSRRRLYYLIDVGRLIIARDLSKAEAEAVGWTKLQIITRHLIASGGTDDDAFAEYLDLAKSTKARDLQRVLEGQQPRNTRVEVFHLKPRERDNLRNALVAFGAKSTPTGLVGKEKALMRIVGAAQTTKPH